MSLVRVITEQDYPAAVTLHAEMDLGYELDLNGKDMIIKNGLFEDGKLVAAVLGRLTTESYLLLDRTWGEPQDRLTAIERLSVLSAREAKRYGVEDTHVWLPPKANCFVRRLQRMGFVEAPWKCMTVRL